MQFADDVFIQILIIALGLFGFWVSKHIRNHKVKNTPLVCPIGFDCNAVVHSDYSRFFGVPVEIFGMIYYAMVTIFHLVVIFLPSKEIVSTDLAFFLALMSFMAFLFSAYLIGVQIFILKKGCSWCIVSATICLFIFFLTVFNYDISSIAQIFSK